MSKLRTSSAVAVVLVAGMLTLGAAAPAAPVPVLRSTPTAGHPGRTVVASGSGFGPGRTVDITFDAVTVASTTTTAQGVFSASAVMPRSARPGPHVLRAVQRGGTKAAQTSFLVSTPWQMMGFDHRNNGFNPWENVLAPANVSGLTQVFDTYPGPYDTDFRPVAVGDGLIFSGDNFDIQGSSAPSLYAFDMNTGAVVWRDGTSAEVNTPPTIDGPTVYTISQGAWAELDAWHAATGAPVYQVGLPGSSTSSPVLADGVIYLTGYGVDFTAAYDEITGRQLWVSAQGGYGSPAVDNGLVFIQNFSADLSGPPRNYTRVT